ncbi:class I SAM-dependent methyltransferase [Streptomyces sp. SID8352]|uniref:class I SAM-dependent methyltransferase n=1 Tax=Streptomyces sp. SID8352 TaxID=2690338 RepID=UPI001370E727|nr:class I SAM-dependent methyltransferase [Streptomyces sp. SID8352]MYU21136.1 methyltransferase domain-containing protein [Streptomyces sp. SID8352]
MTHNGPQRHHRAWEGYWAAASTGGRTPLWDCDPDLGVGTDFAHFHSYMDSGLPLLDVGCGNGTQTRWLADHFPWVIGFDVSAAAIDLARKATDTPGVEYLQLDILDATAVTDLHARIGDAHVYERGVLHTLPPEDHAGFAQSLAVLLGDRGVCFLVEPAPEAKQYVDDVLRPATGLPPGLAKILDHGLVPGGVSRDEALSLFGTHGYEALNEGHGVIHTRRTLPNGEAARLPAFHLTLRRTGRTRTACDSPPAERT